MLQRPRDGSVVGRVAGWGRVAPSASPLIRSLVTSVGGIEVPQASEADVRARVVTARGGFTVAAVQATPGDLDRAGTLEIAGRAVVDAASSGADLVVFPESFVPGYPDWVWRRPPMSDGDWYQRFYAQAVDLAGPDLDPLREVAASARVWVAAGITERLPSGTLNNSVVYVNRAGQIAGVHRKRPDGGRAASGGAGPGVRAHHG